MSTHANENGTPGKPQRPPSKLQELQQKRDTLRLEILSERKKMKEERVNRKQKIHVLTILGSLLDHGGKENVASALGKAEWLMPEDRLAVEYYYDLRQRPALAKKQADASPHS